MTKLSRLLSQLLPLIALTIVTLSAQAQGFRYSKDYERLLLRCNNPKDSLYYPALLPLFLRNDARMTTTQVLALLIGYTGRTGFRPYDDLSTERLITRANDSSRYLQAIAICDTFLATHPLNQQAIIEKAFSFHQLKQADSAAFYKEQFARIMAAMDKSAEGSTPDMAMFSVGPKDGFNFIDKYYHADPGRSTTIEDSEGNLCSAIEMKFSKNGKEQVRVLYFAIQHAVNTTAKPVAAPPKQ